MKKIPLYQTKMYIYELPFDIDKELCRLLDNDDTWKELAGAPHMKYSAFEINEIEQTARRQAISPTSQLLTQWGQLNHRVEELFILLYRMKHVPAMNCIKPVLSSRYHKLLGKLTTGGRESSTNRVDENGNRPSNTQSTSLPLPILLLERGQLTTRSEMVHETQNNTTDQSSSDNVTSSDDDHSRAAHEARTHRIEDPIRCHANAIPSVKYEDLVEATNNWSENNLLGRGGFGQVYKGEWKCATVAVKRLVNNNDGKNKELIQEIYSLNQYRHDNILPLYGYSLGGPEACLVYQFMAGGSLEERLRCKNNKAPLTWSQRHRIAHGVARGLTFLHTMTVTPLIHVDIKPANILLDPCTVPKIGDFGLARQGAFGEDRTHVKVSRVHGTRPYLPEEYIRYRCLSPAVDVFSFGVVLLELATALPAFDRTTNVMLYNFVQTQTDLENLEDRLLLGTQHSNPPLCRQFVTMGLHCTQSRGALRPTMLQVYRQLHELHFPGRCID